MDRTPRPRARQSAVPTIVEHDGKVFVLDRGHERECVIVPAGKPEDDLLNYAASAVLCSVSWACIYQRQARGWATNGGNPLPQVKCPEPFIRRGDLLRAMAPPAEGDTAKRFLFDGEWVLVKTAIAKIFKGREKSPIDGLCRRLKITFREVQSPITKKMAKVANEALVLDAKRLLDAEPPRPKVPPQIAGRDAVWLADFLHQIRRAKTGASNADRPCRDAVLLWTEVGCAYLDGETLLARKESGWRARRYIDRGQADQILESIRLARIGKVHPARQLLRPAEIEREYGLGRGTLNHWAAHGRLERVKKAVGRFYRRSDIERVVRERDIPRGTAADGSKLRTLREAAAHYGVPVRQLRRAIQQHKLASHSLAERPGSLIREHLVSDRDVSTFVSPSDWAPRNGFVAVGQIAREMQLQTALDYAYLQATLRAGAKAGKISSERSPGQRLPIYYHLESARAYLSQRAKSAKAKAAGKHPGGRPVTKRERNLQFLKWREADHAISEIIRMWNAEHPDAPIPRTGKSLVIKGIARARGGDA